MGLDMYLNKRVYVGANFEHNKVTGTIDLKREGKKIKIDFKKVTEITEQVAYWRKANCVHKWFVDNVQDGNDDCGDYYVDPEKLEELLALCQKIKKDVKKGQELLPTQAGFFFGDTEYNENYMQDIDDTIKQLKAALKKDKDGFYGGDFYYHSSW